MLASISNPRKAQLKQPLFCFLFTFLLACMGSAALRAQSTTPKPGFSAQLLNLEAATNSTFNYNANLRNAGTVDKNYQLGARLPEGWQVAFKVSGSQVSSINVEPNQTQNISIEITPSIAAKPGKVSIPVIGVAGSDTARLDLEAVVKGTYGLQLTTPTGKLSENATEGSSKSIQILVRNTGTIPLDGIDLTAQAPSNWQVTFDSSKIPHLNPGESRQLTAIVQVPDKTLSGDYQATLSAKTLNTSSDAVFRITVKASLLTGWIGILVILAAIGLVYFLVKKYGRR